MSPLFGSGGDRDRERRQRSTDERERARQEREERRAAREGREPVELTPLPVDPPAARRAQPPEPFAAPPFFDAEEPAAPDPAGAPAPAVPEPTATPAADDPGTPAPGPHDRAPEPFSAPAPAPEPHDRASEPFSAPEPPAPQPVEPPTATEPPAPRAPEPAAPEPEAEFAWPEPAGTPPAPEPEAVREPPTPAEIRARTADNPAVLPPEDAGPPLAVPEPRRITVRRRSKAAPSEPTGFPDPSFEDEEPDAAPVGVKRVAASALASSAGAEGPPRFGAPPRGTPRRRRGARRVLPLLLLLVVAGVAFFGYRLYQPGHGSGTTPVTVKIPSGSSAEDIGKLLAKQDVVASSFFFGLRARLDGGNLRAGSVALKKDMSYKAALVELTKKAKPLPVLSKVTFPEGPSRRELAARVKAAGFKGSYVTATRSSKELDPTDFGAPKRATLEGFLFPATYQYKPGATAASLVTQQLKAFKTQFASVSMTYAKRKKLSKFDVLTIASMIEREAAVPKDRRLIAAVIYNRLKLGMPLQIDATTRYATGNFTKPLTQSELAKDSPYDTRNRKGLPIGPIGNPGLASLKAAANPAKASYLYYVIKPCANGAHAFSTSSDQFQRDAAAYEAKRQALGGKSPVTC